MSPWPVRSVRAIVSAGGQRSVAGGDQDQFLVLDRQDAQVGRFDRRGGAEQADFDFAGADGVQDIFGFEGGRDAEGDVGMLPDEVGHDRGQWFHGRRGHAGDLDGAGGDAFDRVDGGLGGGQVPEDLAGGPDEAFRGVAGHDAAPDAVEQRHSELAFQSGDGLGERGLGNQ